MKSMMRRGSLGLAAVLIVACGGAEDGPQAASTGKTDSDSIASPAGAVVCGTTTSADDTWSVLGEHYDGRCFHTWISQSTGQQESERADPVVDSLVPLASPCCPAFPDVPPSARRLASPTYSPPLAPSVPQAPAGINGVLECGVLAGGSGYLRLDIDVGGRVIDLALALYGESQVRSFYPDPANPGQVGTFDQPTLNDGFIQLIAVTGMNGEVVKLRVETGNLRMPDSNDHYSAQVYFHEPDFWHDGSVPVLDLTGRCALLRD